MDTKIFLQGFDSKTSSNTSEGLNVQFKGKRKLLPLNDVAEVISQYDQYREEREKCNIIRLTCQVNPICSNVLFNRISEIVKNEGSSGVTFINYGVFGTNENGEEYSGHENKLFSGVTYKPNQTNAMDFWKGNVMKYQQFDDAIKNMDSNRDVGFASEKSTMFYYNGELRSQNSHPTNSIRDTQLTNKTSSFIYHCGLDIFNNHLIRSNTFKTICMMNNYNPTSYTDDYQGFNTIADVMRDVKGNKVVEKISFPITAGVPNHAKLVALHLYEYDDILSFSGCVNTRLIKKYNGWLGFENKSKIKSYLDFSGNTELTIERPIMYMNGGDFVDMYPSRDLYSFVPKYNPYRHRIEKNWNYCITYPSSSYTPSNSNDPFSDIIETNDGLNSLKAVYFDENTRADNGTAQLVIYSVAKHGLSKGDYVNIYKTYSPRQYWVFDENNEIISPKYDNLIEASDEYDRLKALSSAAINCGEERVNPSGVTSSQTASIVNEKVLDSVEVEEVVDDYIFTVFNSGRKLSRNWIQVPDNFITNSESEEPMTITMSGRNESGDVIEKTKEFKIDDETRKFFKARLKNKEEYEDTLYYLVNDKYLNIDEDAQRISFKKVVSDIECEYYVRIFSKLPNFKWADCDTSNEYEIYSNDAYALHIYQDKGFDFENHISSLAFAKNIYTDEVGEIVFTDDIDISNLHDNLGRPLTSIYLTLIKNNKGYKEWYGYDYDNPSKWETSEISGDTVEYSHAFGKLTYGIQTSFEANYGNKVNCINRITNVSSETESTPPPSGYTVDGILNPYPRQYRLENRNVINIGSNEIWYDMDVNFYGDLCYYDAYNAIERHISYIMHRFNTAQREAINAFKQRKEVNNEAKNYFEKYNYDEIVSDDYDTANGYEIAAKECEYSCNNKKEGYYYNPHYEIPIKTFDKLETMMPDFLTIRQMRYMGGHHYQFTTLQQHFLGVGDKAILFDRKENRYYNLIAISGNSDNDRVFTCMVYEDSNDSATSLYRRDSNGTLWRIVNLSTSAKTVSNEYLGIGKEMETLSLSDFRLFKMDNLDCPSYAKVLKDGTCRVIWRNVLNNGFNRSDDSVEEYPFTNGAFYVNKRIDMYVRRQDPYDEYWLYSDDDIEGISMDVSNEDNYVKDIDIEC